MNPSRLPQSRTLFILLALISARVATPSTVQAAQSRLAGTPPNLLIILADDLGYSDLGCYGGEIRTPTLDRLAADGLRYTDFYSTGRCWPSRASILTGYYAQQVDMDPRGGPDWPEWTRLLPHYLREAGYRSYTSGKWHIRYTAIHPANGFDRSYQLRDHNRYFSPKDHLLDDHPLPQPTPDSGYYATTAIADHAIEFLQEHQSEHEESPFFLYLAFTSPHFPLHAPEADIDRYRELYREGWDILREKRLQRLKELDIYSGELAERRPDIVAPWSLSEIRLKSWVDPNETGRAVAWAQLTADEKAFQQVKMAVHAAMVDRMDREIARVVDQLAAMKALDDTLILFLSDNGATAEQMIRGDSHRTGVPSGSAESYLTLGPGWSTAANTPFSLHKHWNHEGGISTPLIVHWPAGIASGGELRRVPGHIVDITPTLLELAGVAPSSEWNGVTAPPFPGLSLVPSFAHDPDWEARPLFFHHFGNRALRLGDWKIVMRRSNDNRWELYHLAEDRAERKDLAAEHPEKLAQLIAIWEAHERQFRIDAKR
ncbi:MAG: arylsulfatase [Opitutaceae bacterium]